MPYALKDKVTAELERLRKADVIEPVQYSDWAATIVPVLKNDGSIRICGDFKQTINTAAIPDKYPLPRVDDLLATLAGGETFTKLDLAHAYQQLVLDEESSKLATINTHQGLYRYKRLPFGISAVPAISKEPKARERVLEVLHRYTPWSIENEKPRTKLCLVA